MRDVDKLIRRVLALTIRCPKKPRTKGDILRCALCIYLKGKHDGLCHSILTAIRHYHWYYKYFGIVHTIYNIWYLFPLFNKKTAIQHFNGRDDPYWWPIEDWKNRYRYMRWLIKEYDKEAL